MRYYTQTSDARVEVRIERHVFDYPEFTGSVDSLRGMGSGMGGRLRCYIIGTSAVVERWPSEIEEASDATWTSEGRRNHIVAGHGCELESGAFGRDVLQVKPALSAGQPQDGYRIRRCRLALYRAGISSRGWSS